MSKEELTLVLNIARSLQQCPNDWDHSASGMEAISNKNSQITISFRGLLSISRPEEMQFSFWARVYLRPLVIGAYKRITRRRDLRVKKAKLSRLLEFSEKGTVNGKFIHGI